jgi:hypothetical protein
LIALLLMGCGFAPQHVSRDDERLKPMWAAIARVGRAALGFSPIEPDAEIRLEGKQVGGENYAAMLHIDGKTSRTIAFRKAGSDYRWIGEQEIHTGPRKYTTVDGTFREEIVVTYEIQHVSGVPLNAINVSYRGDNPRLANRFDLKLADVAPILEQWQSAP